MHSRKIISILAGGISLVAAVSPSLASDAQTTVRDHRTNVTVRDHRTPRPNEVVVVGQGKYECPVGVFQLYKMGYSSISAYDCEGPVYHYTARDGLSLFRANMSSHTGKLEIKIVGILN